MKILKYALIVLLASQAALAGQEKIILATLTGVGAGYDGRHKMAKADLNNEYTMYLSKNANDLRIKCLKVSLEIGDRQSVGDLGARLFGAVACQPRALADQVLISFAIRCQQNLTQQCMDKLADPQFVKELNAVESNGLAE